MAGAAATFAFKKIARHDFLSLNAGVYPTRSSLQITGLQHELLAQYYNVTNLKHELVLGLRTQFFTQSVCTVRNQVQTGGGQSTLSQPCTHRYQRRHPQTTENRHVQVCAPVCSAACKPPGFCCGIWACTPFTRDTVRSLAAELMGAKSQSSPKNTQTLRFSLTTTRYYARTKNGFR